MVRVAGNVVDDVVAASIEFSVPVLGAAVVLVLGHSRCGAVDAAVDVVTKSAQLPGHLPGLAAAIAPAVTAAQAQPGDLLTNAIAANVARGVATLSAPSSLLAPKLAAGQVAVVGGSYDLDTGVVSLLGK